MILSALIADFLKYLEAERNASHLTIKNYQHYLQRFLLFAGDIDPKDIDLILIRKYKQYLSRYLDPKTKKPFKRVTQNYFMIALRSFLRYLSGNNITALWAEEVELNDTEPSPLKILDDRQLKSLLEAPDVTDKRGIRDRAILETLFSTGLRVSELVALNRDTIDLNRREFISDSALLWLEKYLNIRKDTFSPLFIRFQGKVDLTDAGEAMRLTARSIERIVEKYVRILSLPVKATPQTIRYSASRIDKQKIVL